MRWPGPLGRQIDDDDGAIGDGVGPCGGVYQFLMVNGQVRDAVAINCPVFAELS